MTIPKLTRPPFPTGWHSLPLTPANLTLAHTLPVGQSFLWHRRTLDDDTAEEYSRAVDNPPRVICLRQKSDAVYYTAVHPTQTATDADRAQDTTRQWLEDYFQLTAYPKLSDLYSEWRERDAEFFAQVETQSRAAGVRVLRQDPWECLVAFITSTNNHIPRITSLLHKLCTAFSSPVLVLEDTPYHLFPRAEAFPTTGLETTLRNLGFGYRAGFLDATLATLKSKGESVDETLSSWRDMSVDDVRAQLLELKGVGRKVADCVMLMSMDQPSLIPVDTHVHAVASRHPRFPSRLRNKPMSKALYDDVQGFLAEAWGPMGGWYQAVVFAADLKDAEGNGSTKRKGRPKVKSEPTTTTKKRSNPDDTFVPPRSTRVKTEAKCLTSHNTTKLWETCDETDGGGEGPE